MLLCEYKESRSRIYSLACYSQWTLMLDEWGMIGASCHMAKGYTVSVGFGLKDQLNKCFFSKFLCTFLFGSKLYLPKLQYILNILNRGG